MKNTGKILNVKGDVSSSPLKINEDKMSRIPKVGSVIYRMIKTPVDDTDNPDGDETFVKRSLQTVFVEGTNLVNNRTSCRVNGDFEISLEDEEDTERYSDNKIWADQDEAIHVWQHNTEVEMLEAEKKENKFAHIKNFLKDDLKDQRF
jgi:hypothetical protein